MGKWFGPDIVALSIPIAGAAGLFAMQIGRAFFVDPEWSQNHEFYEKPEAVEYGKKYRMMYQQFFRSGRMSWFPNKVEVAQ